MAKKNKLYIPPTYDSTVDNWMQSTSGSIDAASISGEVMNRELVPEEAPTPDAYNPLEWGLDAYTTWQVNRNTINVSTELGKIAKDIVPWEAATEKALNWEQLVLNRALLGEQLNQAELNGADMDTVNQLRLSYEDMSNQVEEARQAISDIATKNGWNVEELLKTNKLNELLTNYLDLLQKQKKEHVEKAWEYQLNADNAKKRHQVSEYYTEKEQNTPLEGFTDLFNVDALLYKFPGLFGSSSSSMWYQAAAIASGAAGAAITSASAGAAAGSLAGPVGTGAGAVLGAIGGAIFGGAGVAMANLGARSEESYAEVFENYKEKFKLNAKSNGINLNKEIAKTRGKIRSELANTLTDDLILDLMVSGQVDTKNTKLNKTIVDSTVGLEQLYQLNMVLSVSDIAQTALQVLPMGKMFSTAIKATKAGRKAAALSSKLTKGLSDKIDNVIEFGLDKTKLNKIARRHAAAGFAGRTALSGFLEGTEEGVQYIQGKDYIEGKYDTNPSIFTAIWDDLGAAARSTTAMMGIPLDPVMVKDKDLKENFWSGALLGGLMTGAITGFQTVRNERQQTKANDFVRELLTDKLKGVDEVQKGALYAKAGVKKRREQIFKAFDMLEKANIEGAGEIIAQERRNADRISSIAASKEVQGYAKTVGIRPDTDEYNLFIGNMYHMMNLWDESMNVAEQASTEIQLILHSPEFSQDIPNVEQQVFGEKIYTDQLIDLLRNIADSYTRLQALRRIKQKFSQVEEARQELNEKYGIKIARADKGVFDNFLDTNIKAFESLINDDLLSNVKFAGVEEPLIEAQTKHIMAELTGYALQPDYIAFVLKPLAHNEFMVYSDAEKKTVTDKINAYIEARESDEKFEQELQDEVTGEINTEETGAEPEVGIVDNTLNSDKRPPIKPNEPPQPPTPPASAQPEQPKVDGEPTDTEPPTDTNETSEKTKPEEPKQPTTNTPATEAINSNPAATQPTQEGKPLVKEDLDRFISENKEDIERISGDEVTQKAYDRIMQRLRDNADKAGYVLNEMPDGSINLTYKKTEEQTSSEENDRSLDAQLKGIREEISKRKEAIFTEQERSITLTNGTVRLKKFLVVKDPNKNTLYTRALDLLWQLYDSTYGDLPFGVATNQDSFERGFQYRRNNEKLADIYYAVANEAETLPWIDSPVTPEYQYYDRLDEAIEKVESALRDANLQDIQESFSALDDLITEIDNYLQNKEQPKQEDIRDNTTAEQIKDQKRPSETGKIVNQPVKEDTTEASEPTDQTEDVVDDVLDQIETAVPVVDTTPVIPLSTDNTAAEAVSVTDDILEDILNYGEEFVDTMSGRLYFRSNSSEVLEGFDGYKPGKELAKVASNPDFLDQADFRFVVKQYKGKPAIYLTIHYKGNNYVTTIKEATRKSLSTAGESYRKILNSKDGEQKINRIIGNLQELRGAILQAYKEASKVEGAYVAPVRITRTNGIFDVVKKNGRVVNRPISEIKGLHIPNPFEVTQETVRFELAKGQRGQFRTFVEDQITDGRGRSGVLHMILSGKYTPSGKKVRIRLNPKKFITTPDIGKLLLSLIVDESNEMFVTPDGKKTRITKFNLLHLIANFGDHTAIEEEAMARPTNPILPDLYLELRKKRFYLKDSDTLVIANDQYTVEDLLTKNGKPVNPVAYEQALNDILNNFHWNMDSDTLWADLPTALPAVAKYFQDNPNEEKLTILPGQIEFTIQMFDNKKPMTMAGWYIYSGIIQSPLSDNVFTNPMMSIEDGVRIVYPDDTTPIAPTEAPVTPTAEEPISTPLVEEQPAVPTGIPEDATTYTEQLLEEEILKIFELERQGKVSITSAGVIYEGEMNVKDISDLDKFVMRAHRYGDHPHNIVRNFLIEQKAAEGKTLVKSKDNKKPTPPLTPKEPDDLDDLLGPPRRTRTSSQTQTIDAPKAKQWVMDTLGMSDESVEVVDSVIASFDSMDTVGLTTEDSIILYEGAEEGTQYHEAFHRVSLLLISDNQRKKIYDTYRKLTKGNSLSDVEVEEQLAEQFRSYMLEGEKLKDYGINSWFRKIKEYIRTFFDLKKGKIRRMFLDIKYGKYKNIQVNPESLQRFRELYGKEGAAFKLPGSDNASISGINSIHDYNKLIRNIRGYIVSFMNQSIEQDNDTKVTNAFTRFRQALESILNKNESVVSILKHWDVVAPRVGRELKQFGITRVDELLEEDFELIDRGDSPKQDMDDHTKASYEKEVTISAEAKAFFASILNGKRDPITGLLEFYPYEEVKNDLLRDMHNESTIDGIIRRAEELGKTNKFYRDFADAIKTKASEELKTKIELALHNHLHEFVEVKYRSDDTNNSLVTTSINDITLNQLTSQYPYVWSDLLYLSGEVFSFSESGVKINTEFLQKKINTWNKLSKIMFNENHVFPNGTTITSAQGVELIKGAILKLLNDISIPIDKATLDDMLANDPRFISSNEFLALEKFVHNTGAVDSIFNGSLTNLLYAAEHPTPKGDVLLTTTSKQGEITEIPFNRLYAYNDFIKDLSSYYAKNNLSNAEFSVLGAGNNKLYPISQHNFITSRNEELMSDSELSEQLANTTYISGKEGSNVRGSILLDHILKGGKTSIKTFVNFKLDRASDSGRDYFQISPIEDYVSKLTAIKNNYMVFPTLADKKTYHLLEGVQLLHGRLSYQNINGAKVLMYDDAIIQQFMNYFQCELDTVEEAIEQSKTLTADKKVKNYHTGAKNGLKFRTFKGVYITENGKPVFKPFVEGVSVEEGLDNAYKYYFNRPAEEKKAIVANYLSKMIEHEVNKAQELGVIKFKEGLLPGEFTIADIDKISAIHELPNNFVNEAYTYYNTSTDPSVGNNARAFAILDTIADNAINTVISIIEIEKIFTGDPAFYKNEVDKIKRLGGTTSTGTVGRLDWNREDPLFERDTYTTATFNDSLVRDQQYEQLYDMFLRGNLKDILIGLEGIKENEARIAFTGNIEELKEKYPDAYNFAELKAKRETDGYNFTNTKDGKQVGNINQADAYVMISPKMYKDMMRQIGEWNDEIEQAYNILENSDNWLNDREQYFKAIKASLRPLKYVSFGSNFDSENRLNIPFFNKMAIFPLFKFMATGDNAKVYDLMNREGKKIDMILFDSAVKVGLRGAVDFYTDMDALNINDKGLANIPVYRQEFKYLRQQLNTKGHDKGEQTAGTQMLKVGLSNLAYNREYTTLDGEVIKGEDLAAIVFDCINGLSDIGKQQVIDELCDLNEDGLYVLSINKLSKLLIKDAEQSNANLSVLDGLKVVDGRFKIPLTALSDNKWIESRINSIINKNVVDITLPGSAFIQMSVFGIKSGNGRRLRTVNEDGSIDSITSITLFKHMIPNYHNLTFAQAKKWLVDNGIIGYDSKPTSIGYRIPTQGLSSISALKVVDVLPEVFEDTIILPESFTKTTGSDFDVDKLYVARFNYEVYEDSDGSIGKDGLLRSVKRARRIKYSEQNKSKEALLNRMMEMYLAIITNKETLHETKIPIDVPTDLIKSVLEDIEGNGAKRKFVPFREYTPSFQLEKKTEYTGSKAGIGPFALHNANIPLTLITKVSFKPSPITEKFGIDALYRIYDNPGKLDRSVGRVMDWFSALINAFVDIAKDPYIVRLNINEYTYNMTALLLRTGKGRNTFYFMAQPILKEIANAVIANKGQYAIDQTTSKSKLNREAIEAIYKKYMLLATRNITEEDLRGLLNDLGEYNHIATVREENGKIIKSKVQYDNSNIFDTKIVKQRGKPTVESGILRDMLLAKDNEKGFSYYYNLLLVLKTFIELQPYSESLSELVAISQVDTKKFGSNFVMQSMFQERLAQFKLDPNFYPSTIENYLNNTYIAKKIANAIDFPAALFKSQMLRSTTTFLDALRNIINANNISIRSERTIMSISNALEAAVKTKFFNQYIKDNNINVRQMFYGNRTIAKRLVKFGRLIINGKYPELLDNGRVSNPLLNYLLPRIASSYDKFDCPDFVNTARSYSDNSFYADDLTAAWQELLDSEHEEIRRFANDLVIYAFYTSGDNYGVNSFFNYVPNDWRISSGYAKFIDNTVRDISRGDFTAMGANVYEDNWYNNDIVPNFQLTKKTISGDYISQATTILLPNTKKGEIIHAIIIPNKMQNARPYIKIGSNNPARTYLYRLVGYTGSKPIYQLWSKKGIRYQGNRIVEYGADLRLSFNETPPVPNLITSYESGILDKTMEYLTRYMDADDPTMASNLREQFKSFAPVVTIDDLATQLNPIVQQIQNLQLLNTPAAADGVNHTDNTTQRSTIPVTHNWEAIIELQIDSYTSQLEDYITLNNIDENRAMQLRTAFNSMIAENKNNSDRLTNEFNKFMCNL